MASTLAYPRAAAVYTALRQQYPELEMAYSGHGFQIGLLFKLDQERQRQLIIKLNHAGFSFRLLPGSLMFHEAVLTYQDDLGPEAYERLID